MRRDSTGDDADKDHIVTDDDGVTELFATENFREYADANPFVAPAADSAADAAGGSPTLPEAQLTPVETASARTSRSSARAVVEPGAESVSAGTSGPSVRSRAAAWWAARTRSQKQIVAGAAAGAALVVVLVAMFAVGSGIGRGLAPDAAASDAAGPDPVGPGVYSWSALQGGECIEPFDTVWAEEFTVVECDEPHSAQLLHRGEVGPEVTVYLDAEGWQGITPTLCDAGALLDFDEAAELNDLTWQLSYAGDATVWANGDRGYSCFITRSSGETLDGSLLAMP